MNKDGSEKIIFMTLIAGREKKEALLTALAEAGIHLANTAYGRGFFEAGYLEYTFGLNKENRKTVITCISTSIKVDAFLDRLTNEFNFNDPDTGIAFTIPIEKVAY